MKKETRMLLAQLYFTLKYASIGTVSAYKFQTLVQRDIVVICLIVTIRPGGSNIIKIPRPANSKKGAISGQTD